MKTNSHSPTDASHRHSPSPLQSNVFSPAHALAICLILTSVAVSSILFHSQTGPFSPPQGVPVSGSISNILNHLETLARAPHPTGSQENEVVREYLINQLTSFGYNVEVQEESVSKAYSDNYFFIGHVKNVMVRLRGNISSNALLIAAHYDSATVSHGAADDGYACASMLELARLMAVQKAPTRDVIFLFTDGEELGLVGAQAFLRHPWLKDVGTVLNFEARGTHGPTILFETSPGNLELIRAASRAGKRIVGVSLAEEVYRVMPNTTDFTIFRQAGLQGLNFANIHKVGHYHTALDSTNNISIGTVQHLWTNLHALATQFASTIPEVTSKNASFFDILGLVFIVFPSSWSIPLAIGTTLLYGGLIFLLLNGLSLRKIMLAVLMQMAVAALAAGMIFALMFAYRKATGSDISSAALYREPFYLTGFSMIIAALTLGAFGLSDQKLGGTNQAMGVLFIWGLLMWLSVVWLTRASYLFLFVVVCMELALVCSKLRHSVAARSVPILLTIPVVALLATTVALLFVAGGVRCTVFLAPLISLGFAIVILPITHANTRPLRIVSVLSLIAAVALFVAGTIGKPTSTNYPRRYALAYLGDADAGTGYLLSTDEQMPPWQQALFPDPVGREPLETYLPWRRQLVSVARKELLPLRGPEIRMTGNSVSNEIRRISLDLNSLRGAESLYLVINTPDLAGLSVDGSSLPIAAIPPNPITVQLTGKRSATATVLLKDGAKAKLTLFDLSSGLPDGIRPKRGDATPTPAYDFSDSLFLRRSVDIQSNSEDGI